MRERLLPGEEFHHKNHKNVSKWSSRKERKCRGLAPRGNRPNRPRWDQDGWTDKTISFLLPRRFRLLCRWGGVGRGESGCSIAIRNAIRCACQISG